MDAIAALLTPGHIVTGLDILVDPMTHLAHFLSEFSLF
jgi:hypothetical protein